MPAILHGVTLREYRDIATSQTPRGSQPDLRTCSGCGRTFVPRRFDQSSCSHACRQRRYRESHASTTRARPSQATAASDNQAIESESIRPSFGRRHPPTRSLPERLRVADLAAHTACICGGCGEPLAAKAPVWRGNLGLGFNDQRRRDPRLFENRLYAYRSSGSSARRSRPPALA
jgi:hypothetical protein